MTMKQGGLVAAVRVEVARVDACLSFKAYDCSGVC